ncbi:hypothetical protein BGAL_0041g00030 [Botrytis galanthina]|uniref:Uncharacterized protein n=1 Tax=Botrytis galanthina TaxID=278940 RepID=A0A4S8R6Z7_9HELO|nr:hypothetical protein BGAL_0041g00030 [Botrytis galanthina]
MNNHGIPPPSSSTMAPSTSNGPSDDQIPPSYGHSAHSKPTPKKSAETKMGILRADSGIAITPNINNAIPNPARLRNQSRALSKGDLVDTIPTDASGATPTFDANMPIVLAKLEHLTTHLYAILTRVPTTPTADLDDPTSTAELSPEEQIRYTSEATIADVSGSISKVDQIVEQLNVIYHVTSIMSSCLDEILPKKPIIPESSMEKGKGKGKEYEEKEEGEEEGGEKEGDEGDEKEGDDKEVDEKEKQTRIQPIILPKLLSASHPPSSPSVEHIEHGAPRFQSVDNLSPAQEILLQPTSESERLRRKNRRMRKWKEKKEQTPTTPNVLPAPLPRPFPFAERIQAGLQSLQSDSGPPPPQESNHTSNRPTAVSVYLRRRLLLMIESEENAEHAPTLSIGSLNLPPSSPSVEHILRCVRIREWIDHLPSPSPPPQEPRYTDSRARALSLFLQCKIESMKKESKDESPLTPISDVLYPHYWTLRDTARFADALTYQNKEPPIRASPKEEAFPIIAGPYNEPSLTKPVTSKPWIRRPAKKERSGASGDGESKLVMVTDEEEKGEGEGEEKGEGPGEGEKIPKLIVTRMMVFAPGQSLQSVIEAIRAEQRERERQKEKEKEKEKEKQQTQQTQQPQNQSAPETASKSKSTSKSNSKSKSKPKTKSKSKNNDTIPIPPAQKTATESADQEEEEEEKEIKRRMENGKAADQEEDQEENEEKE